MNPECYIHKEGLQLESGECLKELELTYHTYGEYDPQRNNVIWVCHALTANSDVFDWWEGLFGENDFFNPKDYFIVCDNTLASCYGSTGPLSKNPDNGQAYYHDFPQLTVRDLVGAHEILRKHLKIERIHMMIGSSLGGMQAMEWAYLLNGKLDNLVILASNAKHSPWGIAFNESQRMAIEVDPTWKESNDEAGLNGMRVARSIALLSYRTYSTYDHSQQENEEGKTDHYRASSYQRYQGEKLARRFNAYSYWHLSKIMDSHDVGRGRNGLVSALNEIKSRTLVIGVNSDQIFPIQEQRFIADNIPNAEFLEINSIYGHDGFLLEQEQLTEVLKTFLNDSKIK
ncbi:homoserine O-acetyltransferase family protein [Labilibaculum euxinus]|uniref:Homoserine O-acetyltransferase n=1 Tax=Labilibaculum euxinus TaxID=2686357 RepID=A0A7M4D9V7_9BACT|nr:homoserine O-acetyltransferase [Labilibaculum euxinus]MUP39436.1 homoserine O-acetyltransferase [Labilibaculum euxinus]MVB08641.1 homoserine O-acetyltransferase [Labilibaculum euxinus]